MKNIIEIPGLRTPLGLLKENIAAVKLTDNYSSFVKLSKDIFNFRLLKIMNLNEKNKFKHIEIAGGIHLNYRCNRGDIQSIREIWLDEGYRLPFDMKPKVIIDLGANIGLTTLYLENLYKCETMIAVEPVKENLDLIRLNFEQNKLDAKIIQAVVASKEGIAYFSETEESNLGQISDSGKKVSAVTMSSLLDMTPNGRADLVKIDIEGGEQDIFTNNVEWLNNVGAIIMEFHPDRVDYPALVSIIKESGFEYYPSWRGFWKGGNHAFIRKDWKVV